MNLLLRGAALCKVGLALIQSCCLIDPNPNLNPAASGPSQPTATQLTAHPWSRRYTSSSNRTTSKAKKAQGTHVVCCRMVAVQSQDNRTTRQRSPTAAKSERNYGDWLWFQGGVGPYFFFSRGPRFAHMHLLQRIRQYRLRISQWGFDKNIKPGEMKAIVRRRQRRKLVETDKPDLAFSVRGENVDPQKIDRFMKRNGISQDTPYSPASVTGTPRSLRTRSYLDGSDQEL